MLISLVREDQVDSNQPTAAMRAPRSFMKKPDDNAMVSALNQTRAVQITSKSR
jgi:hypothetical protein